MRDFVFQNPTRILFGRDCLARVGQEVAAHGKKTLLVSGRESGKIHGRQQAVLASLLAAGLSVVEHGGVRPNPLLAQARAGIQLARAEGVEVVVALGGGSVIDCAKAIAAGTPVAHDVWLFFKGRKSIKTSLPVIAIPTVAGSGSETNSGMVLSNGETRQKIGIGNRHLFPKVAILDPTLTYTLPAAATANGAVDAICHLLEFYLFREELFTPLQDRYSEGLISTLMESCGQALASPGDYQARANLMWASSLALNGLSSAGLGRVEFPGHMIEHSLSALYDVPHGAGLASLLPGLLAYQAERNPARIALFAARVLGITASGERERTRAGIRHFKEWLGSIGAPTSLGELGIPAGDLAAICENTREQARLWRLSHYPPETVREILLRCL
ncbi:iron-containing alcohol dehydrogenase [Thiovibrio sp. JS02]